MSDRERWIEIDGRRWRRSDPAIPERFARELVDELMSARRAVGAAQRAGDEQAQRAARTRVQAAKVALGERGEPWWEPASDDGRRRRIEAAIRALAAHRAPEKTICPSDAARAVGGAQWRSAMPIAQAVARELARAGEVEITQRGTPLDPAESWRGPFRIRCAAP